VTTVHDQTRRSEDVKISATPAGNSLETVVKELSPMLASYLRRLLSDASLAEDLLQETLIRIARGLPDFDGRSSLKTWAFTIATRVGVDHFRKLGGRQTMTDLSSTELPASDPPPDERLAQEQMNACVQGVINGLPVEYRAAILLYDIGGLSARETASACGCTEATAKIRIHRARVKLREALRKECDFYRNEENVLRCHRRD
jgi:RNA polymerase sigma-70 factor (ECF subfamily)